MVTVRIYNIQWDTDGDEKLFKKLPQNIEATIIEPNEDEDVEDIISDYISDLTGFCHYGFEYEIIK